MCQADGRFGDGYRLAVLRRQLAVLMAADAASHFLVADIDPCAGPDHLSIRVHQLEADGHVGGDLHVERAVGLDGGLAELARRRESDVQALELAQVAIARAGSFEQAGVSVYVGLRELVADLAWSRGDDQLGCRALEEALRVELDDGSRWRLARASRRRGISSTRAPR